MYCQCSIINCLLCYYCHMVRSASRTRSASNAVLGLVSVSRSRASVRARLGNFCLVRNVRQFGSMGHFCLSAVPWHGLSGRKFFGQNSCHIRLGMKIHLLSFLVSRLFSASVYQSGPRFLPQGPVRFLKCKTKNPTS